MNSVVNTEPLRAAYNACLPKLSEYATDMGQNEALYQAVKAIAERDDFVSLTQAQRKVIENELRDFKLSGVALPPGQRARFKAIMQELASLTAKFEENLLDATNAWEKHITDESRLSGLPDSAIALARQMAEEKGLDGWLFNLEARGLHRLRDPRLGRGSPRRPLGQRAGDGEDPRPAPRGGAVARLPQPRRTLARHQDGAHAR